MPAQRRTTNLLLSTAAVFLAAADDDEDDAEANELIAIAFLRLALLKRRRQDSQSGKHGRRGPYDRSNFQDFFELTLLGGTDRVFKKWMRMSRESFWHLHSLIEGDPVLTSLGRKPQTPVKYQLASFLIRFGANASLNMPAAFNLAEGTVYKYGERISKALRNIRHQHLAWPSLSQRDSLSEEMAERGFPGCIGILGRSLIRLQEKLYRNHNAGEHHEAFRSLLVQGVTDNRGVFMHYEIGWPRVDQDTTAFFNQSPTWQNKPEHFRVHEYLLADKGYPLTMFTIRPFSDDALTSDPDEATRREHWNSNLMDLHDSVGHAFGRLKGRFQALRVLPGRKLPVMQESIEALILIHNILTKFGDDPTDIKGWNGEEDAEVDPEEVDEDILRQEIHGEALSIAVQEYRLGLYQRKKLLKLLDE